MLKICAHRGSSQKYPENTLLAFDQALREGAHMLEFDIRRTRDGHCVIMHDAKVDRTTSGAGAVSDLTYQQIRDLDAGGGQRVPNLDEVMAYATSAMLNVEVKAADDEDGIAIAEALAVYFRDAHVLRNAFVTAANQAMLNRVSELNPAVRLCNFLHRHDPASAADVAPVSHVLQPQVRHVTAEMVQTAHARNMKVNVYFADDLPTARRLVEMGVDGILTNDPEALSALM